MKDLYCWRCGIVMPMLDENEFEQVLIELMFGGEAMRRGVPEAEAYRSALDLYEEFTGLRETNFRALYHHRIAMYGPSCEHCGKPLRTPAAKLCAACWQRVREPGQKFVDRLTERTRISTYDCDQRAQAAARGLLPHRGRHRAGEGLAEVTAARRPSGDR